MGVFLSGAVPNPPRNQPTHYIDLAKPRTTKNVQREPKAVSRRDFMTRTAAAAAAAFASPIVVAGTDKFGRDRDWTGNDPVTYPEPASEVIDRRFSGRQGNATLQRIRHGMGNVQRCGTKARCGWVWGCLLWRDIPNHRVLRWIEDDGQVSVFQTESGYSNGHSRHNQGRLIAMEHDTQG